MVELVKWQLTNSIFGMESTLQMNAPMPCVLVLSLMVILSNVRSLITIPEVPVKTAGEQSVVQAGDGMAVASTVMTPAPR